MSGHVALGLDSVDNVIIWWSVVVGACAPCGYVVVYAVDVDASAALVVTWADNLESSVVWVWCTLAALCVETSGESTCPCIGTVAVGMYGKIMIISSAVYASGEVGSDLIHATGG